MNKSSMRVSAVLLDMDGTLVDSEHVSDRCWTAWCQRRGKTLSEVLTLSRGRQALDVMRLAAPQLTEAELVADDADFVAAELRDIEGVTAMPGAIEFMNQLYALRVPTALVTSAIRPLAVARMQAAKLPFPAVAICGDDVSSGKPSPEGYLLAATQLEVPITDCVVIEDAPSGILAGHDAGARVIVVGDGTHRWGEVVVPALTQITVVAAPSAEHVDLVIQQ